MNNLQKLYLKNLSKAIIFKQFGMIRDLRTTVLMADDSRVLSSGSVNFRNFRSDWVTSLRVSQSEYTVGTAFDTVRLSLARWWMTLLARQERGLRCLVNGGKPPHRAATRRRVMHPMIVINGSNIVAARLSVGQRRQVPLRQRGELSARLCHTAAPALDLSRVRPARCCVASPRSDKTRSIRSHGTYLMDITARKLRISFHQSGT